MYQAVFGEDDIAYQIGETTEILSRGYLCATPHCVQVLSVIALSYVLERFQHNLVIYMSMYMHMLVYILLYASIFFQTFKLQKLSLNVTTPNMQNGVIFVESET